DWPGSRPFHPTETDQLSPGRMQHESIRTKSRADSGDGALNRPGSSNRKSGVAAPLSQTITNQLRHRMSNEYSARPARRKPRNHRPPTTYRYPRRRWPAETPWEDAGLIAVMIINGLQLSRREEAFYDASEENRRMVWARLRMIPESYFLPLTTPNLKGT